MATNSSWQGPKPSIYPGVFWSATPGSIPLSVEHLEVYKTIRVPIPPVPVTSFQAVTRMTV